MNLLFARQVLVFQPTLSIYDLQPKVESASITAKAVIVLNQVIIAVNDIHAANIGFRNPVKRRQGVMRTSYVDFVRDCKFGKKQNGSRTSKQAMHIFLGIAVRNVGRLFLKVGLKIYESNSAQNSVKTQA